MQLGFAGTVYRPRYALSPNVIGTIHSAVTCFTDADAELVSALTGLGYSVVEAQAALAGLPRDPSLPVEERLRQALAYFVRP